METIADWRKWSMSPRECRDWRLDQIVKESVAEVEKMASAIIRGGVNPVTKHRTQS